MSDARTQVNPFAHIEAVRERFVALNEARLERAKSMLRPRQRDVLELLPLLFHLDHPGLPGHQGTRLPCGIYNYRPSEAVQAAATRLLGAAGSKSPPPRRMDIEALFLMGSAGSIAFSSRSDLDVWLCLRDGIDEEALARLREKAAAVERWAADYGLEVHIFVMETRRFRAGACEAVSRDNAGSTHHFLLLDEFYRTGLWMAGAHPLWWYVPPEHEEDYDDYARRLYATGNLSRREAIDLGGLAHIPASEFFGAALWQLYKGLSAPYKSLLKITLLEAYARDYPDTRLLATDFKRRLYDGEADPDRLDPYLLLLERLEHYARQQQADDLLDLLRRSFYLKVDHPLTEDGEKEHWRHRLLRRLVSRWGWSEATLARLDRRRQWKYPQVAVERRALVERLSHTYLFLSQFAREHGKDPALSARDLDLLGRKLYVAFERKPGKIDRVNPGIAPDLAEPQVTLHRREHQGRERWFLYQGKVEPRDVAQRTPMKSAANAMELLVWGHVNGIITPGTMVILHTPGSQLNNLEIKAILDHLQRLLPPALLAQDRDQALRQAPKVIRSALFINIGVLPRSIRVGSLDKQLVSGKVDIFQFGSRRENLALRFDHLVLTSWGEVYVHHYEGMEGLLDCLCRYLQWAPLERRTPPPPLPVYSFSSHFDHIITQRVGQLLAALVSCFYNAPVDSEPRYLLEAEGGYHLVSVDMGNLRHERLPSLRHLLARLERPQIAFSPLLVDPYALRDSPLPLIFRLNEAGLIQVFHLDHERGTRLYVLDERGSLFVQEVPDRHHQRVVEHLRRFLRTVTQRQALLSPDPDSSAPPLRSYRIEQRGKTYRIQAETEPETPSRPYLEIRVVGTDERQRPVFTLFCNDEEYSSEHLGEGVFRAAARAILEHRRSGHAYPAYITDLDLAPSLLGLERYQPIQTIHFLHYKRRIEARLTEELNRLQSGSTP